jgi:16S rRNA (adenine1518-N6/adenine1519-N6)-dimethyltransferase
MAQTKQQIQSLLAAANTQPRHRFGQNFMIDQNLVRIVADAGNVAPGDTVIEVGPGTGTLTEELLARGANVIAVEIDRDLAKMLREKFATEERFKLIEGDALSSKHALNEELSAEMKAQIKLVANLPYNIASPLIIELLIAGADLLAFTVQKEVADRLRAAAGSDAYGPLSVIAQMLGNVEVLRTLPPQAFWPAPKIESALVRITRENQLGGDASPFGRFVHKLFSFRRKTLKRALREAGLDADDLLAATGADPKMRPEVLTPPQLLELFRAAGSSSRASE